MKLLNELETKRLSDLKPGNAFLFDGVLYLMLDQSSIGKYIDPESSNIPNIPSNSIFVTAPIDGELTYLDGSIEVIVYEYFK